MAEPDDLRGIDTVQGYILALLGADDGAPVPDDLFLQKELYLLARQIPAFGEAANYGPHIKGPYSEDVDNALSDLKIEDYVHEDDSSGTLQLTRKGVEAVRQLRDEMPDEVRERIEEAKESWNDLTREELLLWVYGIYEDMTERSYIKDQVVDDRVEVAKQLYEKDKVSLERASQLADLSIQEFKQELQREAA